MSVASAYSSESFAIGRALGDTFSVIGRNIGLILGLAAVFSGLPTLLVAYFTPDAVLEDTAIASESSPLAELLAPFLFILVAFALAVILFGAVSRIVLDDMQGRKPSFDACVRTGVAGALPVAGILLLSYLPVLLGTVLLIVFGTFLPYGYALGIILPVPVVYLLLRWFLAVPVQAQERCGVLASMKRSAALSRGRRWALFGVVVIIAIVSVVLGVLVASLGALLPARGGAFAAGISSAVYPTLMVVTATVCYLQLSGTREESRI